MNYYKQGDAANADKIKAAFETKGYDISWPEGCANPDVINIGVERNGAKYVVAETAGYIKNIIKTHPDYKELELPVEPKFKIGDWLAANEPNNYARFVHVEGIEDSLYLISKIGGAFGSVDRPCMTFVEEYYHPFSINDAKDGDVLAINWHEDDDSWEKIVIFKKYHTNGVKGLLNRPCIEGYGNTFKNGKLAFNEEVPYYSKTWTMSLQPATKEQRDQLFAKMREAGYEWDADKKELRKIQHYDIANFKPFGKVLVRDSDSLKWTADLFSYIDDGFVCTGGIPCCQCIPFNDDTKHLLGTTDMCDECYVNW